MNFSNLMENLESFSLETVDDKVDELNRQAKGLEKKEKYLRTELEKCADDKPLCTSKPLTDVQERLKEIRKGLAMFHNVQDILAWKKSDTILCMGNRKRGYAVYDFEARLERANESRYYRRDDYTEFIKLEILEVTKINQKTIRVTAKSTRSKKQYLGFPSSDGSIEFYPLAS